MAEFSPVGAALNAFRKRERRFVLARIVVAYLIVALIANVGILALAWPHLQPIVNWYLSALHEVMNRGEPPQPPLSMFMAAAPFWVLLFVVSVVLHAALEASSLRWLTRGEASPLGLSFDADTLRVILVYLSWWVLGAVAMIAIVTFFVLVRFVAGLHPAAQIAMLLVGALTPLALAALCVWGGVRLAPAAALSVHRQSYAFPQAWGVTRGRFWPLLGAFMMVVIGYIVASIIASTILRLPIAGAMYPVMRDAMGQGDPSALLTSMVHVLSTPWIAALAILYLIVTYVLAILFYLAFFGVNAAAIAADEPKPQAAPIVATP